MWLWSAKPASRAARASGTPLWIAVRASASRRMARYRSGLVPYARAELARDRIPVDPGDPFERRRRCLLARVGSEVVADAADGREVDRPLGLRATAQSDQRGGDRGGRLGPAEIADRVVDPAEEPLQLARRRAPLLNGVGDEREGSVAERLAQELRLGVEDAVGEAGIGRRPAVVRLVRVQEVQLAGQADVAPAPVAEGLHARRRDPDRIGVMPVRREPAGREPHLGALEPRSAGAEPDRVLPCAARSFKTIPVGSA